MKTRGIQNQRMDTVELSSTVRGYHVYMRMWTPVVGGSLMAEKEPCNIHDRNAVALFRGDMKVGHVPRKISVLCSSFITRGGTIEAVVTGSWQFAGDLPQGGLDVPCKYIFTGKRRLVRLQRRLQDINLVTKY